MAYFIKRLSIFIFLFCFFYISLITILCNVNKEKWPSLRWHTNILAGTGDYGNNTLRRLKDIKNFSDIDILFLGSSHCYRGVDTRIYKKFGYKAFNLGSSAQSPLNSYYLLQKYINQLNPKLVIVDVFWGVFEEDGSEPFLNIALNSKLSIEILKMGMATSNIQAYNTYLFSLIYSFLYSKDGLKTRSWPEDTYIPGGFVEKKRLDYKSIRDLSKPHEIHVIKKQLKYLSKMIELIHQRNNKVILVSIPVTFKYFNIINNYDEFKKEINDIAKKHKIQYLDFNGKHPFGEEKYFNDEDHLNKNGVNVFNMQLIRTLREMNLII